MSGPRRQPAQDGRLAGAVFWAFAALIVWAPLPFGSTRPWAWLLLSAAALALLGLWGVAALVRPRIVRIGGGRYAPAAALFLTALVWFLLQTTTWLPSAEDALWRYAALTLGKAAPVTASLDPGATRLGVLRMLGYGAVFFLAMQYGRDMRYAERLLWIAAAAGTGYALYGLAIYLGGNETVLAYPKWTYKDDLTSTFVNRNAYGAYAGLGLLATLGLMGRLSGSGITMGLGNRAGVTHFVDSLEPVFFVLVMAALTLGTALLLSHSRGALAIAAAGILTMLSALAVGRTGRRRYIVLCTAALVIVGLVIVEFSGRYTLGRMLQLSEQGTGRAQIHAMTWRAIEAAPVTGFGLDSFPQVFYLFRDEAFGWDTPRFDRAHSAYLELAAEGGAVGFVGIAGAFAYIVAVLLVGLFRRRRNRIYPATALGAAALVGVHAFYDFSIQIPAVTVTCLTLLGVGFAQAWPTRDADGEDGRAEA